MSEFPPALLSRRRFLAAGAAAVLLAGRARGTAAAMPPLGLCGSVDQAAMGRGAGLSFIETPLTSTCGGGVPEALFEKWLEAVRISPLPLSRANLFFPGNLKLVGPQRDLAKVRDYTQVTLARAARAEVKIVTLGSGEARRAPDGTPVDKAVEQFTECSREIAAVARQHGLTIAIEPLNRNETNVLNRLSEVCKVVDAVAAPNLGATADIFHMRRAGERADALRAAGARVRHCHIAEDVDRRAPGVAGDDFTDYFSALKAIGYEGGISLECRWDNPTAELRVAAAQISSQWKRATPQPLSNG